MPRDCWFGISLRLCIFLKHLNRLVYSHWLQEQSGVAQLVKNLPAVQETPVQFLNWEDPLEKGWATHSSILGLPSWLSWQRTTCNARDLCLIPRLGRSPGEGNGYPYQYSGLENSMDCIIHGVAESDTTEQLSVSSKTKINEFITSFKIIFVISLVLKD